MKHRVLSNQLTNLLQQAPAWKILLLAHTLLIATIGYLYTSASPLLLASDHAFAMNLGRALGYAYMGMAVLSLTLINPPEPRQSALGELLTLTVFHIGLTNAQAANVLQEQSPVGLVLMHATFGLIFAVLAWRAWQTQKSRQSHRH